LHRPRLNAIIPIFSRPPVLILIAAPFSSRLSRYSNAPNARRYHFDQATSWARGIAGDLGFFTGAGPVSDSRDPKRA
jgi:hypothetical protein